MLKKSEIIHNINRNYLEKVILALNNVPKYSFLTFSENNFLVYASKKFSVIQLLQIMNGENIGKTPEEIASIFRELNGNELVTLFVKALFSDENFVIREIREPKPVTSDNSFPHYLIIKSISS